MEVWTYCLMDVELARDDPQSAEGLLPALCWNTRTQARDAAMKEINDRVREYNDELEPGYGEQLEDVREDEWTEEQCGDLFMWHEGLGYRCFVYNLKLDENR